MKRNGIQNERKKASNKGRKKIEIETKTGGAFNVNIFKMEKIL